ncbi:MAG: hypothetical protein ACPGVF_07890 [Flavobacteriaceae bacterium]
MPFSRGLYFYKSILRKVSFDSLLFNKELQKAYAHLDYEEVLVLNRWLVDFLKKNPQLTLLPLP